ncbi:carboxymethylenebutenolidase [Allocatelliglobosispora scoriae]|uniref:Carboxymethylenebutenolidase n=1 Tax=Allocatelliglobosispora scoriae TaxID=643052 RepID=A0A841BIU9_9ACTN|nr:dienelactone hydrolase family protein [Allocatelliglobosispora scoriae]MBB5866983.1 carboxymethylenebutenolidase [Allocatelliglobosispora scoriae]
MTMVDIPTADGVADAYLAQPDGDGPHPGVLLLVDAFGLRPRIEEMADRIAARGYTVIAPNVFYRKGRSPLIPGLPELMKQENREQLMAAIGAIMPSLTPELAMRDIGSYLDYLDTIAPGPAALTGYCMGGRNALIAAATYPDRIAAVGSCHAGRTVTDAEDSPHRGAGRITAELYFGHADNDGSMTPEQIKTLEATLDDAGVRYTSELYEGAAHGYTMTDTAAYDAEGERRHWESLFALLGRTFPTA